MVYKAVFLRIAQMIFAIRDRLKSLMLHEFLFVDFYALFEPKLVGYEIKLN